MMTFAANIVRAGPGGPSSAPLRPPGARPGGATPQFGRGFSLIELLVAILIIATLLGILIPVLPRIRDSARRVACGANLHGIGQGVEMYKGDHKYEFPKARYMPPPWLSGDADPPFNKALEAYIDERSPAYQCPGDRTVYEFEYEDDEGVRQVCGMSYTYIIALSGITYEESFFARFLRRPPTETPVLHDYDGGGFETQDGRIVQVDFFHDRRNILFVDGHVGGLSD